MTTTSLATMEIERLLARHPKGYDLSLDRIRQLLAKLGDPQKRLPPVIHVAGTNGKGSVSAFCRAILEADSRSVHVHTSPHLVSWHERYRLGRLSEIDLRELLEMVSECVATYGSCGLEVLEAVAEAGPLYKPNVHKVRFKSDARRKRGPAARRRANI